MKIFFLKICYVYTQWVIYLFILVGLQFELQASELRALHLQSRHSTV
jgi:hypothetical protein